MSISRELKELNKFTGMNMFKDLRDDLLKLSLKHSEILETEDESIIEKRFGALLFEIDEQIRALHRAGVR